MNIKTKIVSRTLLSALLITPTLSMAELSVTPQTSAQWRSVTDRDIEAAYSISAKNHPGMFDVNNPAFPELLKQAKAKAQLQHERAKAARGKQKQAKASKRQLEPTKPTKASQCEQNSSKASHKHKTTHSTLHNP